jgi:superfamily II DNA or RNA helicase
VVAELQNTASLFKHPDTDLFGLWPHQAYAVAETESSWRAGIRGVIVQVPTGGGKSRILRQIVDNHAASRKVIYVLVHREMLLGQLSDELREAGIPHGIIKSGYPMLRYRVQVCSVATLVNRLDKLPEPEIIVHDECHHALAPSHKRVYDFWPKALRLGLTATPRRPDGKSLGDVYDKIIPGPQSRELIGGGFLADFDYFAPAEIDVAGVHHRAGEYVASELEAKVNKREITGDAIEHYRKYADHQPAIVCCATIKHAQDVADQYCEAGYKAVAVHSKLPKEQIQAAKRGLIDGSLEVLVQVDLLGEGVDIKGAACLQMLRHTDSIIIFLQQCGRVLRKHGEKRAIILDHVGNWTRHGLPDDYREWDLEPSVDEPQMSKYKRCPGCLRPIARSAKVCPCCGYEMGGTEDTSDDRTPKTKEGELVDVKVLRAMKEIPHAEKSDLIIRIKEHARTLKDAVDMAKEVGIDHRAAYTIWTKVIGRKH